MNHLPRLLSLILLTLCSFALALTPNELLKMIDAGQYRAAQQALTASVASRGASQKSLEAQAALDYQTGQGEQAVQDLTQSRDKSNTHTLSGILSSTLVSKITARTPLGPASLDRAIRGGYAREVMDDLEQAVALHPEAVEAHVLYAQAAVQTDHLNLARTQLALARKTDPDLKAITVSAVRTLDNALGTGGTVPQAQDNRSAQLPDRAAAPFVWPLWGSVLIEVLALSGMACGMLFLLRGTTLSKKDRLLRISSAQQLIRAYDDRTGPALMDLQLAAKTDPQAAAVVEQHQADMAALWKSTADGKVEPHEIERRLDRTEKATFNATVPSRSRVPKAPRPAQPNSQAQPTLQAQPRQIPQRQSPYRDTNAVNLQNQPVPVLYPLTVIVSQPTFRLPEQDTSFSAPQREERWQTPEPERSSLSRPADSWSSTPELSPELERSSLSTPSDSWSSPVSTSSPADTSVSTDTSSTPDSSASSSASSSTGDSW